MNILARCGLTLAATLFALCSSAETTTYTLSAQTLAEKFKEQLTENKKEFTSLSFTISDGDVTWTLTLDAPEDAPISHSTFKNYMLIAANGSETRDFFAEKESGHKTIKSFRLSTDYFKINYINQITFTAGIYQQDATESQTYGAQIGDDTKQKSAESATTIRKHLTEVSFSFSRATGELSIGSDFPSGGQFAFHDLTIEYESPTANPVKIDEEPVGHIVNLGCDDADAKIYYAFDGASEWKEYDAENPVVLAETGSHTLSYYAKAPDKVQSETATETFNVVRPTGLAYAVAMSAAPITVSGIVVRHDESKGYTLVGPSATSPEDDCLALDNSDCNALRTAEAGSTVRATGRLTDRFGVPALGSLSAVAIDGNNSEITTATSAVSNSKGLPIREFDLRGRDITGAARTARPQIVVNSAGKKYIR